MSEHAFPVEVLSSNKDNFIMSTLRGIGGRSLAESGD